MGQADVRGRATQRVILSREGELGRIKEFLVGDDAGCLVLSGDPGIGKTTLWQAGLDLARSVGLTVLRTRSSEAEARLPFAALIDLVDGIDRGVLLDLPAPQGRALDVALRRADPDGLPSDPMALSAAVLTAVRGLAARGPVLIAVDDAQWLDASSADPITFAARRVAGEVRFMVTRRTGLMSALEHALSPVVPLITVDLASLSSGAIGRLLSDRLGLRLARPVLRHVHETCGGNPLFALELGRRLLGQPAPAIGTDLPLPRVVEDLFGARVRQVSGSARRALLAASLTSGPTVSELGKVVDPDALDDAVTAGLLTLERSRVWPLHPLLAAAMRHEASAVERRRVHLDLASAMDDPVLKARHSALATGNCDPLLAAQMDKAAALAAARGAVHEAAELAAHALRLTVPNAPERGERLLAVARHRFRAGDVIGTAELLEARIDELPAGSLRAWGHLLLGEASESVAADLAEIDLSLEEAGDDPAIRAAGLARKAELMCVNRVERIAEAESLARQAISAAASSGADCRQTATGALVWALVLRGEPIEPALGPAGANAGDEAMIAVQLAFRGQVDQARASMRRLAIGAEASGDMINSYRLHLWLCELEMRCGNVAESERWLQELHQWVGVPSMALNIDRLHAQTAAVAGRAEEARNRAEAALEAARTVDYATWDRLELTRTLGLAALLAGDTESAVGHLGAVWDHTRRQGVDNPGVFPVAADLVESLVQSGRLADAAPVTDRLRRLAEDQQHPWGLATARRCGAVMVLSSHHDFDAEQTLATTALTYGGLGLEFDQARTLLYLGRTQRRYKKRAAARQSLQAATAIFERNGCAGWSVAAESELARLGGRTPTINSLTPSEQRVVDLARAGLSNKEIAVQLFVSARTVEIHLSHAYAKLGVRSRSQLPGSASGTSAHK